MKPLRRLAPVLLPLLAVACAGPEAPPASRTEAAVPIQAAAPQVAAPRGEPEALLSTDPELAPRLAELVEAVEADRVALHVPGLALAIVKDDELVLARGFGLADVEAERAVTPETIFAIGSTSKAFTATLVALLEAEGKLGFDDPITKALPWFELPIDGDGPVTLRDLLSHRTGFARQDVLWYGGKASAEQVLRTALGAEPLSPFRRDFHYNNVMFLAAGEACAAVAGASWAELVRARLLEPLGMEHTSTDVRAAQAAADLALGYQWDEDAGLFERKPMRTLDSIAPAGALNSNVLDLARWVRFLLARGELEGRRLLAAELLAETWKPHNTAGPGARYGLGWFLRTWNGLELIDHGGNIDGFAALVALLPERNAGVVMLTNVSATPLQGTIAPKVFAALFEEPRALAEASASPASDLARFTGTYLANFFQFQGARFELSAREGKLWLDVPGQTVYELGPPDEHGKRPFTAIPDQIQVSFGELGERVVSLTLHQGGFAFECFREGYEPAPEADPAELAPYLGDYADPLTGKTFAVVLSHGRLAVDYPGQLVYELFPPDDLERWVFRANPALAVEFREDALVFFERGTERVCTRVGAPAPPPTLDELMALRRAEAFEARLAELGTCRLSGTMRFASSGIRGTTETVFDASGRFRELVDLLPFVASRTDFDGERATAASSFDGEHELQGDNLDQARTGSPAVFFGDWRRRFDAAEVVRVLAEGERELVQVRLTKGEAPPTQVTLDLATGDLVRAEVRELVDGIGALPKTVHFEDWRDVSGLRLPMRVISIDEASGRVVVEYTELEPGLAEELGPIDGKR
ncbi:MAG TPA: serine hydrolase domain-containing protein [Planctomycetota bacterium]